MVQDYACTEDKETEDETCGIFSSALSLQMWRSLGSPRVHQPQGEPGAALSRWALRLRSLGQLAWAIHEMFCCCSQNESRTELEDLPTRTDHGIIAVAASTGRTSGRARRAVPFKLLRAT